MSRLILISKAKHYQSGRGGEGEGESRVEQLMHSGPELSKNGKTIYSLNIEI